jgi:hypothetical protein
MLRIPVFVSCPSDLNPTQEESRKLILGELKRLDLDWHALGRNDYPKTLPLQEVLSMARRCSGGLILGFEQLRCDEGQWKPGQGKPRSQAVKKPIGIPTPWNNIEAGVLFTLSLPLLIFKEPSVEGGIFDKGVTDVFIHDMPGAGMPVKKKESLRAVFRKWYTEVHQHYYGNKIPQR